MVKLGAQVGSGASNLYSEDIFYNHAVICSGKIHPLMPLSVLCPPFPLKKKEKEINASSRNSSGRGISKSSRG